MTLTAKVVASVWGEEFIRYLAALVILPRTPHKNRMNSSFSFKSSWCNSSFNSNRSDDLCPFFWLYPSLCSWLMYENRSSFQNILHWNKNAHRNGKFVVRDKTMAFGSSSEWQCVFNARYSACTLFVLHCTMHCGKWLAAGLEIPTGLVGAQQILTQFSAL